MIGWKPEELLDQAISSEAAVALVDSGWSK